MSFNNPKPPPLYRLGQLVLHKSAPNCLYVIEGTLQYIPQEVEANTQLVHVYNLTCLISPSRLGNSIPTNRQEANIKPIPPNTNLIAAYTAHLSGSMPLKVFLDHLAATHALLWPKPDKPYNHPGVTVSGTMFTNTSISSTLNNYKRQVIIR